MLFYAGALLFSLAALSAAESNRQRLAANLLANYDAGVLPVVDEAKLPLMLRMENTLAQLQDVDDKAQTVTVIMWMRLYWVDAQLTWNPEEYGGVHTLNLPVDRVWKPVLVAQNRYVGSRSE